MGIKPSMKFYSRVKVFHCDIAEDPGLLRMLCHDDWQMCIDVSENFDASSLKVK
jgi:hypothetical protein